MLIDKSEWLSLPIEENSFWLFGKSFECPCDREATLEIAAEKDMEVWLNGELLEFSQLADVYPAKSVTAVPVQLKAGINTLNVSVFNMCVANSCNDGRGVPGIAAIIYGEDGVVFCKTDATWLYRRDPGYAQDVEHRVTWQFGMVYCYDARAAIDWHSAREIPDGQPAVVEKNHGHIFRLREIDILKSYPLPRTALGPCGYLLRRNISESFAETCANDFFQATVPQTLFELQEIKKRDPHLLSPRPEIKPGAQLKLSPLPPEVDGCFITIDLCRETVGFLDMELAASAGTVVDIAYGEHLDDGRVRPVIGNRKFADRYICKEGFNHFTHRLRRIGARYLELHITQCGGSFSLGYVQLLEQVLPLPEESSFHCEDRLLVETRKTGIHTLRCCMHEHYEDCPWREQALYSYDSRNQALYGYYVWGNYGFAGKCFNLLGDNYCGNGQIGITSPNSNELAIQSFSLVWVTELYEYYMYSGDFSAVERNKANIFKVIDAALSRKDPETGLYQQLDDKRIWNFFEWVDGLVGYWGFATPEERLNACHNGYLLEALNAVNYCFNGIYSNEALELAQAIRKNFRVPETGLFRTQDGCKLLHQHTQALMLCNGAADPAETGTAFASAFRDSSLVPVSFSAMPYFFKGWLEGTPEARRELERIVIEEYGSMLFKGATTFWETKDGGDAFDYAGSLCHAWSSLPVYYCHAIVLGVTPLEPGFRRFRVRPYPGSLSNASGTVPTPAGNIWVSWKLREDGVHLKITAPAGLQPVVASFPEFPVVSAEIETAQP